MNKNTGQNKGYKKYVYRTHESSVTQRSNSQQNEQTLTARKNSRTKIKKEVNQNSFGVGSQLIMEDLSLPLGEYRDNGLKMHQNVAQQQKQEMKALRQKNVVLERQIGEQSKEIEQLKVALASIKDFMEANARKSREGETLKEVNQSLQMQYENQTRELQALTSEIQQLKGSLGNSMIVPSMTNSLIKESKISRRAEYAKNYELCAESIPKHCQTCNKYRLQNQQLRLKYQDQLRKRQEEKHQILEKHTTLLALQQEIRTKKQCVDYLTAEIQKFQKHSKNLMSIVSSLEGMLEMNTRKRRQSHQHSKSISNQPQGTLVTFRY